MRSCRKRRGTLSKHLPSCRTSSAELEIQKYLSPLPISIIFLFFKHDIYLCLQTPNEEAKDKMLRAKAHVFVGRWLKETGQTHNNVIIDEYERSIKLCPTYVEKERPTKGRSKNIKLISGGRRDISFLPSTTIHS